MILTIGMIVKNEEKYLQRCLEAVKPILEKVDSELVIADTGSTDGTEKIAREFTDKVFHFEWCDDFAAARNSTLERALGEWYMALDADEILTDTASLVEFFNSGEYKKYNSASFVIKNFKDRELTECTFFNAPRLVKIQKDTHYIHPVHECLHPYAEPVKILPMTAEHLGYILEDNKELIGKKCERNLALLFKQLRQNSRDYFCLYNLCQTYLTMKDYKNAGKYCEEGLKCAGDRPIRYSFYFYKAITYCYTGNDAEALDTIDEYFAAKHPDTGILATDMEMFYLEAGCYYRFKNYRSAAVSYAKFIKMLAEFVEGKHHTNDTLQHSVNFTDNDSFQKALYNMADSLINSYEYSKAVKKTADILEKQPDRNSKAEKVLRKLCAMAQKGDYSGLNELYEGADAQHRTLLMDFIEKAMEEEKPRKLILKAFSAACTGDYAALMRLRYAYDASTLSEKMAEDFFEKLRTFEPWCADALCFALKTGVPVKTIASKLDTDEIVFCLDSAYLHVKEAPDIAGAYCKGVGSPTKIADAGAALWLSELYRWAFSAKSLKASYAESLFQAYAEASRAYLAVVFRDEYLDEEYAHCLPKRLRTAFFCVLAQDSLYEGKTYQYMEYMNKALNLAPEFHGSIAMLSDALQEKSNSYEEKMEQIRYYAESIKSGIADFAAKGDRQKAAAMLKEYESLRPNDTDIPKLRTLIK